MGSLCHRVQLLVIIPYGSMVVSVWYPKSIVSLFICLCLHAQLVWLFVTWWTVARQSPLSLGIFQTRILEWVTIYIQKGKKESDHWNAQGQVGSLNIIWRPENICCLVLCIELWKMKVKSFSHVWLFATPRNRVHEIFQARILEWVAFHFCRAYSQPRDRT